jgi:hypothetical protein
MPSNWQRWVGEVQKKGVSINEPTHRRLKAVSEETSMSMQFWADAAVRFFFAHTSSAALINAAKGVTLEEYSARVNAADKLITHLIEHGMEEPEIVEKPLLEPTRKGEEELRRETLKLPGGGGAGGTKARVHATEAAPALAKAARTQAPETWRH